jgi:hypothetical protein
MYAYDVYLYMSTTFIHSYVVHNVYDTFIHTYIHIFIEVCILYKMYVHTDFLIYIYLGNMHIYLFFFCTFKVLPNLTRPLQLPVTLEFNLC